MDGGEFFYRLITALIKAEEMACARERDARIRARRIGWPARCGIARRRLHQGCRPWRSRRLELQRDIGGVVAAEQGGKLSAARRRWLQRCKAAHRFTRASSVNVANDDRGDVNVAIDDRFFCFDSFFSEVAGFPRPVPGTGRRAAAMRMPDLHSIPRPNIRFRGDDGGQSTLRNWCLWAVGMCSSHIRR